MTETWTIKIWTIEIWTIFLAQVLCQSIYVAYPVNPEGSQVIVGSMDIHLYIRHCQESNSQPSQPVPFQVRTDPTRPQWRTWMIEIWTIEIRTIEIWTTDIWTVETRTFETWTIWIWTIEIRKIEIWTFKI